MNVSAARGVVDRRAEAVLGRPVGAEAVPQGCADPDPPASSPGSPLRSLGIRLASLMAPIERIH